MKKHLRVGMMLGAALMTLQAGLAATDTEKDKAVRQADTAATQTATAQMEKQVRRELITLPYYSLFDTLSFRVEGETVTLTGKVSRPTLKADAENAVKSLEGVENVVNEIRVLPASFEDDRLRLALYRSIYSHPALDTLLIRAVPPIHIIVENGQLTLEGFVATEMQRTIAGMQANSVPGLFSVTNNLRVDGQSQVLR